MGKSALLGYLMRHLSDAPGWYGMFREDSPGGANMIRISQLLVALHEEHHDRDCRGWPAGRPGPPQPR